jgi:hypothetical protein
MILSEDRLGHLALAVVDALYHDDIVDYSDDDVALRAARKGLGKFVQAMEEADQAVKEKVASLKRGVVEGSPEWDILYGKYLEEELQRRGTK